VARRLAGRSSIVALVGLFAGLLYSSSLSAQSGTLRGRVVDSAGGPIAGAVVSVDRTVLTATSGPDGAYALRGIPAGSRTVLARAIGYLAVSADLVMSPGGTTTHDFTLSRTPVMLAPINVVVGSRARHPAAEALAVPVDVIPSIEKSCNNARNEPMAQRDFSWYLAKPFASFQASLETEAKWLR
jgi:iron complex outermembrane receptor protein